MNTALPITLNVVVVAVLMGFAWRALRPVSHASLKVFASMLPLGAVLACVCALVEVRFFGWLGVSPERPLVGDATSSATGSLLAMLVFFCATRRGLEVASVVAVTLVPPHDHSCRLAARSPVCCERVCPFLRVLGRCYSS